MNNVNSNLRWKEEKIRLGEIYVDIEFALNKLV